MNNRGVHVFSKDFYNFYQVKTRSVFLQVVTCARMGHLCDKWSAMQSYFGFHNITQLIFMDEIYCR